MSGASDPSPSRAGRSAARAGRRRPFDAADTQLLIKQDLAELTAAIKREPELIDDATRDRVTRMVSAVHLVLFEHRLDSRGRCRACSRLATCPAKALIAMYARTWLATGHINHGPSAGCTASPFDWLANP
jgi:hypothetical protein